MKNKNLYVLYGLMAAGGIIAFLSIFSRNNFGLFLVIGLTLVGLSFAAAITQKREQKMDAQEPESTNLEGYQQLPKGLEGYQQLPKGLDAYQQLPEDLKQKQQERPEKELVRMPGLLMVIIISIILSILRLIFLELIPYLNVYLVYPVLLIAVLTSLVSLIVALSLIALHNYNFRYMLLVNLLISLVYNFYLAYLTGEIPKIGIGIGLSVVYILYCFLNDDVKAYFKQFDKKTSKE